jgi:UDP-N-acetylmuramoyl-tripeptide--D-alanyl-D-alanine ligase
MIRLKELSQWLSTSCANDAPVNSFTIDSRHTQKGDVFVALEGAHCDGHQFIKAVYEKGAAAAIVRQIDDQIPLPQLRVKDPVDALKTIATKYRQLFHIPVIALTGSNGKTTVKEIIAQALPQPSLATSGNLNNHLGVPLMVMRLKPEHRCAVFELGASKLHDIQYTANICKPDVALVNNIAPAHIEGFGSIDNVARTKGEIYQALPEQGIAIVNDDDDYAHFWDSALHNKRIIRFSQNHPCDIFASAIQTNAQGCARFVLTIKNEPPVEIALSLPGKHMISNALAAAACLYSANINITHIAKTLASFKGVQGRQTLLEGLHGSRIIDDSYNANLRSTVTAVEVLANYPGRRILVLGDMGELGEYAHTHHAQIGEAANAAGIDQVLTIGALSAVTSEAFGPQGQHFDSQSKLLNYLQQQLDKDCTVLIKGSRSAAMESIVKPLVCSTSLNEG